MVRPARNRALPVALLMSLAIFATGAAIGYSSISPEWAARSLGEPGASNPAFGGSFGEILVRNLGAIALLYSGVMTLGLTALMSLAMVGMYVGATMAVGVSNVGTWQVVGDTWFYAPIEFGGCVVAAAAGLYPVVALIGRMFTDEARTAAIGTYVNATLTSLKVFGCAAALITLAAVIEAVAIAIR